MERKQPGKKSPRKEVNRDLLKVLKYQNTVVQKSCLECGKTFQQARRLKAICSDECKKARRSKFRPQTFKDCEQCGTRFGPVDNLSVRFCGAACKYKAAATGRRVTHKTVTKARSAQSLLAYHIKAGNIIRPKSCEACGEEGRIEGAHYNYDEPLKVRWLCRSCHVRWDKAEPKHATYRVEI